MNSDHTHKVRICLWCPVSWGVTEGRAVGLILWSRMSVKCLNGFTATKLCVNENRLEGLISDSWRSWKHPGQTCSVRDKNYWWWDWHSTHTL